MKKTHLLPLISALSMCFMLGGCGSSSDTDTDTDTTTDTDTDTTSTTGVDITKFVTGAFSEEPTIVDCTLEDDTVTTCYQFIQAGLPAEQDIGPFCPETTTSNDTADVGIWFDGSGEVWDATGDFIVSLPSIYDYSGGPYEAENDSDWILYNDDLTVKVTDSLEACQAAAQPMVDPEDYSQCVQCALEYFDNDLSPYAKTFIIPINPTPADTTGNLSTDAGITLNGIELAAPAPVSDILGNYTVAIFDDCGGHINPIEGYHYHASTGCTEVDTQEDGHSAMLGYAMDGYGIYGAKDSDGNETEGLDECRGIEDDVRGYHYHVGNPGENISVGCFHGKTVKSDAEGPGGPPDGGPQDGGPQGE